MPKPFFEDMVKRKTAWKNPNGQETTIKKKIEPREIPGKSKTPKTPVASRSRYLLWAVAAFSAAILLIALSFLLEKAEILVYPKTQKVALNENLSASKTPGENGLLFDLVVISGEESKILAATEEKEISQKATGTVVIFNGYSFQSQRLDTDTRLSGSNGKLYKTKKQIIVPGMKTGGTPGSVEVEIYAAEAGAEYNSGPLDFQIVGFKGSPKYDKFKVRSKTGTEITGGFSGTTLVAGDATKQAAIAELKDALRAELLKKATDQLPEGFILWKEAATFIPDKIDFPLGEKELKMTIHGTLYGLLLDKQQLAKKIAEKKVEKYDESDIYISDIHNLIFTLSNPGGISFENMETISFNLSGSAQVVWKPDTEEFTATILGRSKKDFASILSQYENIDRAELSLSPVWKRSIPENSKKVKVKVNYPEEKI